jgi:predicted Ser/Thr protein kinase
MAQYFNNKNLKPLGEGAGGGEVLTNGTYAYKFVKTADIKALRRELKFTLIAAKIGVAPHIYDSEIKQTPDLEWVMRIKMKKLKGNLLDYAKTVAGGESAVLELKDIMTDLHIQGRICHNDISNPENIMHDGKRLYIIDYSEATATANSSKCKRDDFLMFEKISRDIKKRKIPEPASNSPVKTFRVLKLNNSPASTPKRFRSSSGSPASTPKRFRSPSGSPASTPKRFRSPSGSPASTPKRFRSPSGSPASTPKRLLL